MCLILLVWRVHPRYRCIIAANRDEFHQRAAVPARWWADKPHILAGRDLAGGGTWLGLTRSGRFAALTNFRGAGLLRPEAPSRGALVTAMLERDGPMDEDLRHLERVGGDYNAFNLIVSDGRRLGVYETERRVARELGPGIYAVSNHLLDTPWPKVQKAKSRLREALADPDDTGALLEMLRDDVPAPDEQLPRSGLGIEWDRMLSSAFVRSADYGTRCSTIVRVGHDGAAQFDEWCWDPAGAQTAVTRLRFTVPEWP